MRTRPLTAALIAACLAIPCLAAAPDFVAVLDAPATRTVLAQKSLLNGITLAGKRLVCAGQRGHIIYSDDEGKSWVQASVPVGCDLVAVHFPTPKEGWAVGHNGVVLHSSDAGATWIKQFDGRAAAQVMATRYRLGTLCATCHAKVEGKTGGRPKRKAVLTFMEAIKSFVEEGPDKPFLDVWFDDEKNGYIVGAFNLIFRTADGGKSWDPWFDLTDNPKLLHIYAMRACGSDLFLCGEQGLVMKLDRAAGRFKALAVPYNGTFFGLAMKPGVVLVYGLRGNAYRSVDGGASWEKVETGTQSGLVGGTVTEDGRIVLVSQAGQILASSDDGKSFTISMTDHPFPATAVTSLGSGKLALAGIFGFTSQQMK